MVGSDHPAGENVGKKEKYGIVINEMQVKEEKGHWIKQKAMKMKKRIISGGRRGVAFATIGVKRELSGGRGV